MKITQISLGKLRSIYPIFTLIVLVSIIASCFYSNIYTDFEFVILTALIVAGFVLLNITVQWVISTLSVKLAQQKAFDLIKNEMSNAILLHTEMAKHEENIYKIHHDMKNHLGVIYSMLEEGKRDEALDYTRKLQQALKLD